MDNGEQSQYQTLCHGAAMYILLGSPARATEALVRAKRTRLNLTTVKQDVDRIVRAARREPGGIFEIRASLSS